jgi:undecaprenyl diphosphate synthase
MALKIRSATAEEQALLAQLDEARMPAHVAVIMDGNRRWARSRNLPALMGHRSGERAFKTMVRACSDLGIKVLTAYAFSLENWKRSEMEVSILMRLFEHYSRKRRDDMQANAVRFQILGNTDDLPERVQAEFARTIELTRHNQGMILNLAVNYGSRGEIVRAAQQLAREVAAGRLRPEDIDEAAMNGHLYTAGMPDPDLLIRTSGEVRISNFLLWQMAYTEFWFTPALWPDFSRVHLLSALLDYQSRDRRFGGGTVQPDVERMVVEVGS